MENLQGRTAIITGAASGIGRGTALALAKAGAKLVIADINEQGAKDAASQLGSPDRAIAVRCDVTEDDAFVKLKDAALAQFGRVDIVMNNAGVLTRGRPEDLPLDEWRRMFDIGFFSVVRSNHVFLPLLMAQGEGHIVNTASFAGLYTYAYDRLPYAASKAALVQLSEGLALYLKPKGIGVTCLCPGPVRTNIMNSLKSFGEELEVRGPGPQFTLKEPDQVGDMVVDAIRNDVFMLPTDGQVRDLLIERASDWDGFLKRQIEHPFLIASAAGRK